MPPMLPPGIAVLCFLDTSATIASVVMSRPPPASLTSRA